MKKNDIRLALGAIIIAVICALVIQFVVKKDGAEVVVTVDGKVYATLELDKNTQLDITGLDGGENKLVIENGQAYMTEADCADKICVNQGRISKTGETIVCLPHKVVVEIKGAKQQLDGVVN